MKQNIFMNKCCAGVLALSSVLAACSMSTSVTSSESSPIITTSAAVVAGDVNADGTVSADDLTSLQNYLLKKSSISQSARSNADLNSDGKVNAVDLALLKRQVQSSVPVSDNYIHLMGTSISAEGTGVTVNGTTVTITKGGTYTVDGSMTVDSQIVIATDAADTTAVEMTLNGVSMTNSTDLACISVENADKTKITFKGTNELNNTFDADTASTAVIYAKDDLTFTKNSTGTLAVNSCTEMGIYCNNDIKINGGSINVTTDTAGTGIIDADAVKAKGTVEIAGGTLTVDASGDGVKSTQTDTVITGGTVSIKAGNDAIQAATDVNISGGTVVASGDRGITAEAALTITGGSVLATATDNQVTYVTNASTQGMIELDYAAEHKKGEAIGINSNTYTANKKYSYVLVSDSSITSGSTYKVTTNGIQMKADEAADGNFNMTAAETKFTNVTELSGTSSSSDTAYYITYSSSGVVLKDSAGAVLSSASNVAVSGSEATITVPGEYDISGSSTSGKLIVDVDKTAYPDDGNDTNVVTLVFNGLDLSNSSDSPVYIASIDDKCEISVKNGTTNTISDGSAYTNADAGAGAIYACDDLKIKGKGTLTVNGNCEDGIVCKNDLKLYNGNITVNAVDDGIRGKDSVTIGNAADTDFSNLKVTVNTNNSTSGGDGIKSTSTVAGDGVITVNGGTVDINSYADGFQAEQEFVMNGGDVTIYTYQGSGFTGSVSSGSTGGWGGGMSDGNSNKTDISAKGIKAVGLYDTDGTTYLSSGNLTINGGTLNIDSSDDCIHCAGVMRAAGGVLTLASADDGMHSDNDLYIGTENAGTFDDVQIYMSKCYEGVEGVYIYQNSGTVYIVSTDDGYNAAGGADSSGTTSPGGWGGNMGMSSTYGELNLNGGLVVCNSANGDHDGLDSNGPLNINGGYICANGQEPLDCGDGYSITYSGGTVISMTGGNTSLNTRYTFTDSNGNAIVSLYSASGGSLAYSGSSASAQSGASVSGGTEILTQSATPVTIGGTISGGTQLSTGGSSSGTPGGRF